ncbi:hypothetical protein LX36DRAFT_449485 [Colletotrichum falcatum]|nr:hypothetical protein LX36DRAFT_449485 [Colletotrichum falcatum]
MPFAYQKWIFALASSGLVRDGVCLPCLDHSIGHGPAHVGRRIAPFLGPSLSLPRGETPASKRARTSPPTFPALLVNRRTWELIVGLDGIDAPLSVDSRCVWARRLADDRIIPSRAFTRYRDHRARQAYLMKPSMRLYFPWCQQCLCLPGRHQRPRNPCPGAAAEGPPHQDLV